MLGIDPARYRTGAFVVAAVAASVAGSLYAYYLRFISPDLVSVTVALSIVIMLALGGVRTVVGPLLGVALLQGLPLVGQSFALWQPLVAGLVLVVVLTYLPGGLWGGLRGLLTRTAIGRYPVTAAVTGDTPVLTAAGLTRRFGGVTAVDRVGFTVAPASIRAVIGPNGAGKTTLLDLITGFNPAGRRHGRVPRPRRAAARPAPAAGDRPDAHLPVRPAGAQADQRARTSCSARTT